MAFIIPPNAIDYPRGLCRLEEPPTITVSKSLDLTRRRIAIVGSREATSESASFAQALAFHLARAGVVVVSGGARGVDFAAHQGALKGGGATWLVSPTGYGSVYPPTHAWFVNDLEASNRSRVIWPFPAGTSMTAEAARRRNGVLVGLSEAVVVVQAALKSGSRNAARWARQLGVTLYVVPGPPWDFVWAGSNREIHRGDARIVLAMDLLLHDLGIRYSRKTEREVLGSSSDKLPQLPVSRPRGVVRQTFTNPPEEPVAYDEWSETEKQVYSKLSTAPTQRDKIIMETGLSTSATITALLTLSLKDVVVEGPDGFFRTRLAL